MTDIEIVITRNDVREYSVFQFPYKIFRIDLFFTLKIF
jgi:hypothetical protein